MALAQEKIYTIDDIYALPEGQRAELIDGRIYDMAPPSTIHQRILMNLAGDIREHIKMHNGSCEVNYVEPDISVICNKDKINDKGCAGSPDWIIEVTSPSSTRMDYAIKLFKYRTAGVREYWIVNPMKKAVQTYVFEGEEDSNLFSFDDEIPVHILDGLTIRIATLL